MPRVFVPDPDEQEALLNERRLLTPGGAAQRLRVSRQAVHASAERPGGRLLMWVFAAERAARLAEMYVDFGERRGVWDMPTSAPPDAVDEWRQADPEQLKREAVERHQLALRGLRQEPLL